MSRRLILELAFVGAAAMAALAARALLVAVYAIPSASMLPALAPGDYVLVAKWPFGWARARHRRPGVLPRRGEVVVFRAPPLGRQDYVKRVIGLPGDQVALHGGALVLNGAPVPRWRIADLVVPLSPEGPCRDAPLPLRPERDEDGRALCRVARWRELLPGGATVDTLDLGRSAGDEFGPATVPPGRLFLLGDDRDRSADSRWPARDGGAIGMVPADAVVGRARVILFSVDRDAPTWWRAIRLDRIGAGF